MKKILICVGTRPNFIKITQFKKLVNLHYKNLDIKILHTGQHYDSNMSEIFFQELEIDKPDIYLNAEGETQIKMISDIMIKFEVEVLKYNPDVVLVPGDVNSSVACALVASRLGFKLGHIESGLRSFDRDMPEEINRILIDKLSDIFFITEESGINNLIDEGHKDNIHFVGNTMIDTLVNFTSKVDQNDILQKLNITPYEYCLSTFHRPSNVDNKKSLEKILKVYEKVSKMGLKTVLPIHPRTKNNFKKFKLYNKLKSIKGMILTDSLGYLSFMKLVKNSNIVITDSGGIQEETTYLQIPCITVRENTERPVTIIKGTNILCPLSVEEIIRNVNDRKHLKEKGKIPENWDGKATKRILDIISNGDF